MPGTGLLVDQVMNEHHARLFVLLGFEGSLARSLTAFLELGQEAFDVELDCALSTLCSTTMGFRSMSVAGGVLEEVSNDGLFPESIAKGSSGKSFEH